MRKVIITICVLLFLLCLSVVGAGVEAVSTSIELTSGCSYTKNITVDNTLNKDLKVHISTEISPDGEGITITYHPTSPFVLKKKSNITIEMTIETSILLMPQQYIIETSFYEDYSYKTSKKYSPSSVVITEEDNGTDNETELPDDEVNDTEDEVFVADVVIGNNDGYIWLVLLSVIVVAVVSLLFYFRKKKEDIRKK